MKSLPVHKTFFYHRQPRGIKILIFSLVSEPQTVKHFLPHAMPSAENGFIIILEQTKQDIALSDYQLQLMQTEVQQQSMLM